MGESAGEFIARCYWQAMSRKDFQPDDPVVVSQRDLLAEVLAELGLFPRADPDFDLSQMAAFPAAVLPSWHPDHPDGGV